MNIFKEPLYSQSYVDTGTGIPVILLHGLFGNVSMWRSTVNVLRDNHRVVIPRLPLYDVPIHRANLAYLTEILHEFIVWHKLKDVILVGTDIGAQLALAYAYHHPQQVKKVVVSGCSGLHENLPLLENTDISDYDLIEDSVKNAFYKKDIVPSTIVSHVYNTVNTFSKNLHISAFARESKKSTISNFLSRVNTPVLMIWGLQDKITPPEVALAIHDLLKTGTLNFINECGHYPMIEKADVYNTNLIKFFEQY